MTLKDPFNIRSRTTAIVKNSRHVIVDTQHLTKLGLILKQAITKKQLLSASQFGRGKILAQHIFLLDTVNFCFWAKANEPRWSVEYPPGKIVNGWEALTACFERALAEKIPLLDSQFLIRLTLNQAEYIFRSHNQTVIPLLQERVEFLHQVGLVLQEKFSGHFENLLEKSHYDAVKLVKLILENFPCFADYPFLKRAQICVYDLSLLPGVKITNIQDLTVFADYKLPQILRSFGVLTYSTSLAKKIDNYILISKNSQEEIEIRAATIWVGELLAKQLKLPPAVIDNALWYLSQHKDKPLKPHHRTLTTCY